MLDDGIPRHTKGKEAALSREHLQRLLAVALSRSKHLVELGCVVAPGWRQQDGRDM